MTAYAKLDDRSCAYVNICQYDMYIYIYIYIVIPCPSNASLWRIYFSKFGNFISKFEYFINFEFYIEYFPFNDIS